MPTFAKRGHDLLVLPFKELFAAPGILWGILAVALLSAATHLGVLNMLVPYFTKLVFAGGGEIGRWPMSAPLVLSIGTGIFMFLFGFLADIYRVRRIFLWAAGLTLAGLLVLWVAPQLLPAASNPRSPLNVVAIAGLLLVAVGRGLLFVGACVAIWRVTNPVTVALGFVLLSLTAGVGVHIAQLVSSVLTSESIDLSVEGVLGVIAGLALVTFLFVFWAFRDKACEHLDAPRDSLPAATDGGSTGGLASLLRSFARHPLANRRYLFFLLALMPVNTLFAYNWLVLPQFVYRTDQDGSIGSAFESLAGVADSWAFMVLVVLIAAITSKVRVYNVILAGTTAMVLAVIVLLFGANQWTLASYVLGLAIGEAVWSPRFTQCVATIAPENQIGAYAGIAGVSWFAAKVVASQYSSWFLERFCPAEGTRSCAMMWLCFALIAAASPVLLFLARRRMLQPITSS